MNAATKYTLLTVLVGVASFAQAPPQNFDDSDGTAPSHAVARISLIDGQISVRHGDAGDQVPASLNAPLLTGDRVVTGGGRTEVQVDSTNVVRVAPSSEIAFSDLQYKHYELQFLSGSLTYRVVRDGDAVADVNTPLVSVRPLQRGVYRMNVHADGSGEFTVWSGSLDVYSARGTQVVRAGNTMRVRGSAADPEYQVVNAGAEDDWDRWSANRDRDLDRSVSSRYVSSDVYGTEQLDSYGRWVYEAPYGYVWVPTVAADWAPYRYGNWYWADYYGWSWVGYEPWGWAPYHWGRWYHGRWGWAWYPGSLGGRYYWRPAMVGFFGWGTGAGFGFGFGNVGWFPLAPYERFSPWYGRGGVAVVNQVNITNVYRNARVEGAISGMRAGEFGRTAVGAQNLVRPGAADLGRATALQGSLPTAMRPAASMTARSSVVSGTPNVVSRPASAMPSRAQASSAPAAPSASSGGWRRIDPTSTATATRPAPQAASAAPNGNAPGSRTVQIRPPIVQNRATGSSSTPDPGHRSSFGGPHQSAPPPAPSRSGPAPSGGGRSSSSRGGGGRR